MQGVYSDKLASDSTSHTFGNVQCPQERETSLTKER